jgi:hypothetical protein
MIMLDFIPEQLGQVLKWTPTGPQGPGRFDLTVIGLTLGIFG